MARTATKTKVGPIEIDDSPVIDVPGYGPLTERQKRFTEAYRACGVGVRAAREAGFLGDDATLAVRASELIRTSKVRWYLAKLGENDGISRGQVTEGLKGEAAEADHAGSRVRAYELLGKGLGMFGDENINAPNRLSDDALVALICGKDESMGQHLLAMLRGADPKLIENS